MRALITIPLGIRRRAVVLALALGVVAYFRLAMPVAAEPAMHQRVAPLAPWIPLVDDSLTADSAWAGIAAALPSFADSAQRGFGWYLMYCAAAALGHVDSMRVAAESSYVYSPTDPSGFRALSHYLARSKQRLEMAEHYAQRALDVPGQVFARAERLEDLRWLGHIQGMLGKDSAATATLERHVAESSPPDAWVLMRLGHLYSRQGRTTLAIDRLGRGLSAFPQDSTFAANSATLLDSLLGVSGGDPRSVHAHVTQQLEASKRAYWLDSHRDGHRAPDAALVDMDSERRVSLRGLSGITVAYAWATWCGPCRASMPTLQAWAGKARTRPVRVLTINAEGEPLPSAKAKTSKFFTERGLTLPVLLADSAAAARWGLGGFPMTLVLRDGEIVFRGHAGDLVPGLEAQLASLGSRPLEHPAHQ